MFSIYNILFTIFALKNNLSEEHTLKNQDELLRLRGMLTPEAHPIAFSVGG
jgi:hypothetical protein